MGKCNFKRMLSLLLALATVVVLCPAAPAVQAADTDLCPCCGKAISSIKWTSRGYTGAALSGAGHYKITGNMATLSEYTVTGNLTIDLNNCLLRGPDGSRTFTVDSGGTLTLLDTTGGNGRLSAEGATCNGGVVYVKEGGTLNIVGGRVRGVTITDGNGGAIYNEGTVNINGGQVDTGKTPGGKGGHIYNVGTLNIYSGQVINGVASGGNGGNIYNTGTVNIYGGEVVGGTVSGDNCYGGNIYSTGVLNIRGGSVYDGKSQDHGGNIFLKDGSATNIYSGTIADGVVTGGDSFAGHGGNIYAAGANTVLNIYGGVITGGETTYSTGNGGNIRVGSGAQVYMYGGTIENGSAYQGGNVQLSSYTTLDDSTKRYSAIYILGGTITAADGDTKDLHKSHTNNVIKMYNCYYNGSQDITEFIADCCCYKTSDTGVIVWNSGYFHDTCIDCIFAQAMEEELVQQVNGGHTYQFDGDSTYTCAVCGNVFQAESIAATVNGNLYERLEDALADAGEGAMVQLQADVTVSEAEVSGCTLDLNGFALTADAFTSASGGNVIDTSKMSAGKLVADSVTLAENNTYLPITLDGGIHFAQVGFKQWIEPQDEDTTKVKFYFTQRAVDTIIDDAIQGGSTEIDVQIRLTWTDGAGVAQDKTYTFGQELMQKYAEKWGTRVFVATIAGTSNITNLTCAYQVTSTATSGVELSASTMIDAGYIHENLTWDAINSYPIKTSDMTVDEMRQLCLDFVVFGKSYLWTPDTSVSYIRNKNGTADEMKQGTVYGGVPYVGYATGNCYRMMDYINPDTGLVDMHKALPALGTKDQLAMSDMRYFGSQCSINVYWGWGRVMNSANYLWSHSIVPSRDFVILGEVQIPEDTANSSWSTTYGTDECVAENGEQVLFAGYAQLKKADGVVYYTNGGHVMMVYSEPVVVYNGDGTINGEESYLTIVDQHQKWEEVTNDSGDTYLRKENVDQKMTFQELFDSSYIPFTFKEFLGTDPIEVTEVSLAQGSTTLVSGTVSEADRSFVATTTTDTLTWSQLFSSKITSNYGISDAYIVVRDNYGNEMYRHAVRTGTAGNKSLTLKEEGDMVTTWETRALTVGKTYNAYIEVQLATGERPVIWEGTITR
ncbi:MAG: hypothetical protein IJZ56_03660 [Oscillospiraceae bacterium]|nr:hypothetical protein [Oscillospiraceae bacterium]